MAERDDDAKTGFTIAAWHAWREDDEQAAKDLGAALARLLPPERWRELDGNHGFTAPGDRDVERALAHHCARAV
jgi:hypothetical protein